MLSHSALLAGSLEPWWYRIMIHPKVGRISRRTSPAEAFLRASLNCPNGPESKDLAGASVSERAAALSKSGRRQNWRK